MRIYSDDYAEHLRRSARFWSNVLLTTTVALSILLFTLLSSANAKTYALGCYQGGCSLQIFELSAAPRIIDASHPLDEERDAKWVAFCKPTFRTGPYGVTYYVYAQQGCEYGRTE